MGIIFQIALHYPYKPLVVPDGRVEGLVFRLGDMLMMEVVEEGQGRLWIELYPVEPAEGEEPMEVTPIVIQPPQHPP